MEVSFISVIFDILAIGAIVVFGLIGKRKGLLKTLFSFAVVFVAIFLAKLLSPYVTSGLTIMGADKAVEKRIATAVEDVILAEQEENVNFDTAVEKLKLPETVSRKLKEKGNEIVESTGKELSEKITKELTEIVMKLIGYVILAILVIVALVLISLALKLLTKLPLVGPVDSFGGLLAGVFAGVLIVVVVSVAVYAYGISHAGSFISKIQRGSFIVALVDNIGIIRGVIK